MPEGHTIHRLARDLNDTLRPRPIRGAVAPGSLRRRRGSARPNRVDRGRRVGQVPLLLVRLRARPSRPPGPDRQVPPEARARAGTRSAWSASASSPTSRCGTCPDRHGASSSRATSRPPSCRRIGADPLRRRSDTEGARQRIQASGRPIGALLLDQTIIAGIGNVYRAELLFICGIHPARTGRSITDDEFDRLWTETVEQLRRGVAWVGS